MPNNPKISIIMSVYNEEKYLRDAIESVLTQTFTDFEFIIVNDGSTDGSLEIIKSYDDERIKIINNERNIGLTSSLNKALKLARGEYIARQDADDISLPSRFEKQIKFFEKHPETALLGTSCYRIDDGGRIIGKWIALVKPSEKDLLKENQFCHGSVMIKRRVIDELGGYNELMRYCQDYELWLRIARYYTVRNLTQILYKLRLHSKNIRFTKREESTLYGLLAIKLAKNELDDEALEVVKNTGIRNLYSYLSKNERIYFHKKIANWYMSNNDLKSARREYMKVFSLNPFDVGNNLSIACSCLGKGVVSKSLGIYKTFVNFSHQLKKYA